MNPYYPVFLDLRGRSCLVIGGGAVAEEKVEGLLAVGAKVRLIAPQPEPPLQARIARGEIEHLARDVQEGDLVGFFLVFAERLGAAVHDALRAEAERHAVFLNVQDETPHCSFIAASIARKGDLVIALSTGGKAPALAVRLRQWLDRELGQHHARFLELAGHARDPLARRRPAFDERRRRWYELVDSDVLDLLQAGHEAEARQRFLDILGLEETDLPAAPWTSRPPLPSWATSADAPQGVIAGGVA